MTDNVEFQPFPRPGQAGHLIDPTRPVTVHGHRIEAGRHVEPHAHPRSQLAMNLSGVMRVEAGCDTWIVPPSHAVWIPGGLCHSVRSETDIVTRNVHVDPSRAGAARPEATCTVLRVTPLLREMAVRLSEAGPGGSAEPSWQRLADAMIDEIARLDTSDLGLPGGRDPRLAWVTRHLGTHPGETRGLPELAEMAGTTERTLARLFRAETGLTFREWRTRQRMLVAMEELERGKSTGAVADALGYGSSSAFIAAFRRSLGAPPQQVLRGTQAH